ncbi:hypothetical protein QTP88_025136 [Uroleucon formosanum]
MSSSNSPSCNIIRTPPGPFTVTKSNDFSLKMQCCFILEINFSKLCDELEVEALCDDEILENSNEKFQKLKSDYEVIKNQNEKLSEINDKNKTIIFHLQKKIKWYDQFWTPEDISSAITLRSVSPKAYRFLRTKKNFPLPGMSTLRAWASKLFLNSGLFTSVMSLMQAKGESLSKIDKLTVLSFDETYISKRICFDKQNEQVLGPSKRVQTVIARGLVKDWKQPIYFDYDTNMTKKLLFYIIKGIRNIGYDTVGIVNDMGPSNIGLWRNLNISITNTSFVHPYTQRKIHVFADFPHLMKLLRNHLLDLYAQFFFKGTSAVHYGGPFINTEQRVRPTVHTDTVTNIKLVLITIDPAQMYMS